MIYRVEVNLERAQEYLKKAYVEFDDNISIWVKAEDPDGACANAVEKICKDILSNKTTTPAREAVIQLKNKARVTKISRGSKKR